MSGLRHMWALTAIGLICEVMPAIASGQSTRDTASRSSYSSYNFDRFSAGRPSAGDRLGAFARDSLSGLSNSHGYLSGPGTMVGGSGGSDLISMPRLTATAPTKHSHQTGSSCVGVEFEAAYNCLGFAASLYSCTSLPVACVAGGPVGCVVASFGCATQGYAGLQCANSAAEAAGCVVSAPTP